MEKNEKISRYFKTLARSASKRGVVRPIPSLVPRSRLPVQIPISGPTTFPLDVILPCEWEGPIVNPCSCGGPKGELRHVRHCLHPSDEREFCTRAHPQSEHPRCDQCADYSPWPRRINEKNLWPEVSGLRFNPSIIEWPAKNSYVFVSRNGWKGSEIHSGFLDSEFRPVGEAKKLELNHRGSRYGREDPRLFIYREKLHISFTGVIGRPWHTNVLYARLIGAGEVDQVFFPKVPGRALWEKNHVYFEYQDELYAIYSIRPHRIMRVEGENVEWAFSSSGKLPWVGGEPRGGTSPQLVDDEWWCFFHDRIESGGHRVYRTGVYTFENKPPFRILRMTAKPILVADPKTKPVDQYASVVWAGGAVRRKIKQGMHNTDDWIVAHGIHDRWSELYKFSHEEIERQLVKL